MIKEFTQKYPLLFSNKCEMEPINMFGIECEQGWKSLLHTTCGLLYRKYKSELHSLEFWKKISPAETYSQEDIDKAVDDYTKRIEKSEKDLPVVSQIKSKFGTLRFYADNLSDYSRGVIDMAEEMSGHICEVCGEIGKTYHMGWHSTLCDKHALENYGKEKLNKYEEFLNNRK